MTFEPLFLFPIGLFSNPSISKVKVLYVQKSILVNILNYIQL